MHKRHKFDFLVTCAVLETTVYHPKAGNYHYPVDYSISYCCLIYDLKIIKQYTAQKSYS